MKRKTVSAIVLTLLLTSMLTMAFNIRSAKASETIHIQADGSIDPPTAPIFTTDNVTYVLTDNVTSDGDGIVVERDNIILDGSNNTLQWGGFQYPWPHVYGIYLDGKSNVTVRDFTITNFWCAVYLSGSTNNKIFENIIAYNADYGIMFNASSDNNCIYENNIIENYMWSTYDTGIWLDSSSSNTICGNNLISNLRSMSVFGSSNNNNVSGNNIVGGGYFADGVSFIGGMGNVVSKNNITNFWSPDWEYYAALSIDSSSMIISENNIANNTGIGISLDSVDSIVVRNCLTNNSVTGLSLSYGSGNSVSENFLRNNGCGFELGGESNDVSGNIIMDNEYGLRLGTYATNNTLRDNVLANNSYNFGSYGGINDIDISNSVNGKPIYYWINKHDLLVQPGFGYLALINCTHMTVQYMNLTGNEQGILLAYTNDSIITNNVITGNDCGILIDSSSGDMISGNNVTNNGGNGIEIDGGSNNTISGNCVLYNGNGATFMGGPYGILVSSSFGNVISENKMVNPYCTSSIFISGGSNNTVSANKITDGWGGLKLGGSNNTVTYNDIAGNVEEGVWVYYAYSNLISCNNISCNPVGICMGWLWESSSFNIISCNAIVNNSVGIQLGESLNNSIFHNYFANNTQQVWDPAWHSSNWGPSINTWDEGYPSGGNYWSNYNGTDLYSGQYQNETCGDSIGDIPYLIDENNTDHYPLMGPWIVGGENVTVTLSSDVTITFGNVSSEGISTLTKNQTGPDPPSGFKLATETPTYYDIKTTANYTGPVQIRVAYNDTGLTQDQENHLKLMHWNPATLQWDDVTTHVDTENNVIWGETSSLSPFALMVPHIPGDVDGNLKVNMGDISALCDGFGSTLGLDGYYWHHPSCILCPHSPSLDVDGNGQVDMGDITTGLDHFGQHYP